MKRRDLLTLLGTLPFMGSLRPEKALPVSESLDEYVRCFGPHEWCGLPRLKDQPNLYGERYLKALNRPEDIRAWLGGEW